ncbi:iron chaperone [Marinoscillum luteum]|uniref:Iron chaperone n=1 Tax=Marinoscillum luteum TaxID=861051 RepID=A0ABW7N5X7_9BACT
MKKTDSKEAPQSVDEYIADFPIEVQEILKAIRKVIQQAAPEATESISYGIPTFSQNGVLVHFGGYKQHIGFYPAPRAIEVFKEELSGYEGGKGTIKFPLNKPIPMELITRIVQYRLAENLNKSKNKKASS